MRIGEFAKKYGLTIDTIRHYMDLELLLPDKKGGHYFFGEEDITDLEKIVELKELKFTLAEIRKIIIFSRLSQLRSKEDKIYIQNILSAKREELEEESQKIKNAIEILEYKVNEINPAHISDKKEDEYEVKRGIPLSFIQFFACPICDETLELEEGKIANSMVMEGFFKCNCGYNGNVSNGIYTSLDETDMKKTPKQKNTEEGNPSNPIALSDYVEETAPSFINRIYKSVDTMIHFTQVDHLDHKIILELGTGYGFFLRRFLSYMKPNTTYVITDHDIHRVRNIKLYLEKHMPLGKFVFICAGLRKLPIKNEAVDYIVNYATGLSFHLTDDGMLDSIVLPKIKKGGKLISSYSYVKSGSRLLSSIPETSRKYYEEKGIKKAVKELPLKLREYIEMDGIEEVESKYETLLRGSKLYYLIYCGEKE